MLTFLQVVIMLALAAVAIMYAGAIFRVTIGNAMFDSRMAAFWNVLVFAACGTGAWFMLRLVTSG